ncbi:MAG: hypothetical protein ACPL3P_08670 [Anaerolineales bacterium]
MTENNSTHEKPFEKHIPEEAREHLRAARKEIRQGFEALFPPEFVEHRRKARKEVLLAWRSMIDHAIQRMEQTDH